MYSCRTSILVLTLFFASSSPVQAQREGFIYGQITTRNKNSYTGQIRWSSGQTLWADILLASKKDNPLLKYLNSEQLRNLSRKDAKDDVDWEFMNLWKNKYPDREHAIRSRFGDISSIRVTGDEDAVITFKNGDELKVVSHDDDEGRLGRGITVYDDQKKEIKVKWNDIDRIRFLETPNLLPHIKGHLLYGTVTTTAGKVTGIIQWDMTKNLTTHRLYGKTNMGRHVNYSFEEIKSIEKRDRGSFVKFYSGDELMLRESRDVNWSNRGIMILHSSLGRIIVDWKAFKSISFSSSSPSAPAYKSYLKPQKINGQILTKDNLVYRGNFVFDLDETLDVELLDGSTRSGINYQVPFRNISSISPVNQYSSKVTLKNDETLVLGGEYDVSDGNWGIMMWLPNSRYKYLAWNRITEILFK